MKKNYCLTSLSIILFIYWILAFEQCEGEVFSSHELPAVPAIEISKSWNRFRIFLWPYKTDVLKDYKLYKELSLSGFQIDRGEGQNKRIQFAFKHEIPYYVGHTADKGFLFLKDGDIDKVIGKHGLVVRPQSLADPETLDKMKNHIRKNIQAVKIGPVAAFAFDDEISLGVRINPCDVDIHPRSLAWFRSWLAGEYETIKGLNDQWDSDFDSFGDVMPAGFEQVREQLDTLPVSQWNLSPWMDFRHFMDFQFSYVLADLTQFANALDPETPAGFAGGQGPGPWGGYDYAMLARAVQWMEAYDIHGTNEILRSLWDGDRRLRMQTFFATGNEKLDSWFLWYYLLHGCQGVIAWPEGWFHIDGRDIAPHILRLKELFKEVQGEVSEVMVDPDTHFDPDPIGIYYSHPSIQAGWAMDAVVHKATWINRKGSLDNANQSMGVLRKVWCRTLEDLGFQYDFISYLDLERGDIDLNRLFKVIILPKTVALSDDEARILERFVEKGGTLIADYLCGLLDDHGKGRGRGVLDGTFGIVRDEVPGYMNGQGITEIDGEKYQRPFLERMTFYENSCRYRGVVIFERGLKAENSQKSSKFTGFWCKGAQGSVMVERSQGEGRTFYLNLTPLEYWDPSRRFSDYGKEWRSQVFRIFKAVGMKPRVEIFEAGTGSNMIEPLFWKNGSKRFLGLVKNPTSDKELSKLGRDDAVEGITGQEVNIELRFFEKVHLVNLRSGKDMGAGVNFKDRFKPWEGSLYEIMAEE